MFRRVLAVVAVYVGAALIGFNPNRWDVVVLVFPREHGIHLRDIIGAGLVTLGVIVLWRSSPARSELTDGV